MRLQEAANYSENQDQESDCASLDSNITPDSSAGAEWDQANDVSEDPTDHPLWQWLPTT